MKIGVRHHYSTEGRSLSTAGYGFFPQNLPASVYKHTDAWYTSVRTRRMPRRKGGQPEGGYSPAGGHSKEKEGKT